MIVNALAPGLNTIPLTSTLNEMSMLVHIGGRKRCRVAWSVRTGPLHPVVALNHSALAALAFQVALPAKLLLAVESRSVRMAAAEGRKARAMERSGD